MRAWLVQVELPGVFSIETLRANHRLITKYICFHVNPVDPRIQSPGSKAIPGQAVLILSRELFATLPAVDRSYSRDKKATLDQLQW